MFDFFVASLMIIAPYNVEAYVLLRIIWFTQLHLHRMLGFIWGATIAPMVLR